MPEVNEAGLDVSKEEERYLRRTFRRFALPYLVVIAVTVGVLGWAAAKPDAPSASGSDELQSLVAEAASLREAIAGLREEVAAEAAAADERMGELEGRVARLRKASADGQSPAELASRLDHAHQRINALEGRLKELTAGAVAAPDPAPAAAAPPPAAAPAWSDAGGF
ncbi:MAG: hypothetical protein ACQGVC_09795 [Myxococcota bacterium]